MERASPACGRGRLAIGWNFPHDAPAQLLALTHLQEDTDWLFTTTDARRLAQQHTGHGRRRRYSYTDLSPPRCVGVPLLQSNVD